MWHSLGVFTTAWMGLRSLGNSRMWVVELIREKSVKGSMLWMMDVQARQ